MTIDMDKVQCLEPLSFLCAKDITKKIDERVLFRFLLLWLTLPIQLLRKTSPAAVQRDEVDAVATFATHANTAETTSRSMNTHPLGIAGP